MPGVHVHPLFFWDKEKKFILNFVSFHGPYLSVVNPLISAPRIVPFSEVSFLSHFDISQPQRTFSFFLSPFQIELDFDGLIGLLT